MGDSLLCVVAVLVLAVGAFKSCVLISNQMLRELCPVAKSLLTEISNKAASHCLQD